MQLCKGAPTRLVGPPLYLGRACVPSSPSPPLLSMSAQDHLLAEDTSSETSDVPRQETNCGAATSGAPSRLRPQEMNSPVAIHVEEPSTHGSPTHVNGADERTLMIKCALLPSETVKSARRNKKVNGALTSTSNGVVWEPDDVDHEKAACSSWCWCCCCCRPTSSSTSAVRIPPSNVLGATSLTFVSFEQICAHTRALRDSTRLPEALKNREKSQSGGALSAVYVWCAEQVPKSPNKFQLSIKGPFVVDASTPADAAQLADETTRAIRRMHTSQRSRFLVLINPFAGKSVAAISHDAVLAPILKYAAGATVYDIRQTTAPGDAEIYARQLNAGAFDACLCVGGDGTVHEALQGLCARSDWRSAVSRLPLLHVPSGSGNAFATSSGIMDIVGAARAALHGPVVPLDVLAVLQPRHEIKRFGMLGLAYGLVANADIGTEHLRHWGDARFTYGALGQLLGRQTHAARISYMPASSSSSSSTSLSDDFGPESQPTSSPPSLAEPRRWNDGIATPLLDEAFTVDSFTALGRDRPPPSGWFDVQMPPSDCKPTADATGNYQLCVAISMAYLSQTDLAAPSALLGDGCLHLVYTGLAGPCEGVCVMLDFGEGKHIERHPNSVATTRCHALYLEPVADDLDEYGDAKTKTWLTLDGEVLRASPTLVEVKPALCRAIVAPEAPDAAVAAHRRGTL